VADENNQIAEFFCQELTCKEGVFEFEPKIQ